MSATLTEVQRELVLSVTRERDHYRDALREIVRRGCAWTIEDYQGIGRTCREIEDNPEGWCWRCVAAEALEEAP